MSALRILHAPICLSCRLRASIAAKQFARSRKFIPSRTFASIARRLDDAQPHAGRGVAREEPVGDLEALRIRDDGGLQEKKTIKPEDVALRARERWGDFLPEGVLSQEEFRVYERLYGTPLVRGEVVREELEESVDEEELLMGTGVLKEVDGGVLEEVEFEVDEEGEEGSVVTLGEEGKGEVSNADERLARDIEISYNVMHDDDAVDSDLRGEEVEDPYQRTHPWTLANRFSTSPSTVSIPPVAMLAPIQAQLAGIANRHLAEAADRVFGGIGLPYSTSTPTHAKTMQQKPIALEAGQSNMSPIEGDVFMAVLWPGIYASVMSILTETRKRLGTSWAEGLVKKAEAGELRILDAGGSGAGILAVREMLRAEWERMHEDSPEFESVLAVAEADGRVGGASLTPPLGHATVLTGSDTLRKRASLLLDNTTFVPRLPDYVHAEQAGKKGKFDIVIAPHTLWGLTEDYLRRTHVNNLWSMVSQDAGVLLLLEKGVARGFEIVAAAREMLLERFTTNKLDSNNAETSTSPSQEHGSIISPCTNHNSCPMYQPKGMVKGRRDICHFSQRFIRPPFLQNILGARDKNFEDVKFSYLSIQRGAGLPPTIHQNAEITNMAFSGYENSPSPPASLTLPRAVLPPLKRQGHVILDLCTPEGELERWTVPKSFSKQAFRDARKSSWGDLWAMGAKTRVPRVPKVKKRKADLDVKLAKRKKVKGERKAGVVVGDEEGEGERRRSAAGGKSGGKRKG